MASEIKVLDETYY